MISDETGDSDATYVNDVADKTDYVMEATYATGETHVTD